MTLRRQAAAKVGWYYYAYIYIGMIHLNNKKIFFRSRLNLWGLLLSVVLAPCVGLLQAQNVIGGSTADPTAILDLQSSSRGLLMPRMTTAQRAAIVNPAVGLMIYNTSLACVEVNAGTAGSPDWTCLFVLAGQVATLDCSANVGITSLLAGIELTATTFSIPYTGGAGGFYSSQTVASTGVAGLTATIAAGAFNHGSGSVTCTITGTPAEAGVASFALSIGGKDCSLSLPVIACGAYVASGVWKEFMCHNLGANTQANPFVPSWELIGNYYQWGRNPGCFGRDGIDGSNPCSSPVYGAAGPWGSTTANDNAGAITGWNTTVAPTGAWQDGVKTANDPCPAGFRMPTKAQWDGVANSSLNTREFVGTWTESSTSYTSGIKFGSSLLLPAAGRRSNSNGTLGNRGSYGYYWSSTEDGTTTGSKAPFFEVDIAGEGSVPRSTGMPVRCVAF